MRLDDNHADASSSRTLYVHRRSEPRECALKDSKILNVFFFFFLRIRRPPRSPLFPYPPLSRSNERLPAPALAAAMDALSRHYGPELGEPLRTAGLCLYRDGQDSVAWHGDNSGRQVHETVVAILSLGTPRALLLRPRGGGPARRFVVGPGDLLAMGGTVQ